MKYNTLTSLLKDIAAAIREKEESTAAIPAKDFAARIRALHAEIDTEEKPEIYAFHVNQSTESDPAAMVTYPSGCSNENYTPARMNFESGEFEYNEWVNAFFIKNLKVVMLAQNGQELYEIDPNDYTKKKDSDDSVGEEGNVMIAFPKVYFKTVLDDNGEDFTIYVSNKAVDEGYKCYAHIDTEGNELDYCYISAYEGSIQSSILKSLTGKVPTNMTSLTNEIKAATANGDGWYTGVLADYQMINRLLLLIGRNTDQQAVFGAGLTNYYSRVYTGSLDDVGLFWGNSAGSTSCVKIFGIENYYGDVSSRIAGLMLVNGQYKIKLTSGTDDGSEATSYNTTGSGYITLDNKFTSTYAQWGYFKKMIANDYGLFPDLSTIDTSTPSSSQAHTYWSAVAHYNPSNSGYPIVCGNYKSNEGGSGFYMDIQYNTSTTTETTGVSLSFKKKI